MTAEDAGVRTLGEVFFHLTEQGVANVSVVDVGLRRPALEEVFLTEQEVMA